MSVDLSVLRGGAAAEITRWATILEEQDAPDLDDQGKPIPGTQKRPKLEFLVRFVTQDMFNRIAQPYQSRGQNTDAGRKQQVEFQVAFCRVALKGIRGLTPANLCRISDYALTHPEQVKAMGTEEIEFTPANRDWIAANISAWGWEMGIQHNTMLHDRFVADRLETEKNGSGPSSDSPTADSPQNPAVD